MNACRDKAEEFSIQFLGMKFSSTNPGKKTIFILFILLIFFLVLVLLLKAYVLPVLAIGSIKALYLGIAKTAVTKNWFDGRSP
jgi:ABC-type enterochelin transport system permease subunit